MLEFDAHDVKGFFMSRSLSQNDFRQVLSVGGWEIIYLGTTTYQFTPASRLLMMAKRNLDMVGSGAVRAGPVSARETVAHRRQAKHLAQGGARQPGELNCRSCV